MEWIVCVAADDNFPDGNVLDWVFVLLVAIVVDDGDKVVRDFVNDNDRSGGGCFERTMLKFKKKRKLIKFCFFDLVVEALRRVKAEIQLIYLGDDSVASVVCGDLVLLTIEALPHLLE